MIQEVVAIIDRSGSMAGKEADVIGGINTTIKELQENKKNEIINFSLKFFDDKEYVKIRSLDIEKIRPLNIYDLRPRGQTALLDAIGNSLIFFINKKMNNPNCFDSCIMYISTDGLENASKKFNNENIKNLINEAKKYSIELVYIGSNQDAILESSKFGLDVSQAMNYNETTENTASAYRSLASAAKRQRNGSKVGFSEIERLASISKR